MLGVRIIGGLAVAAVFALGGCQPSNNETPDNPGAQSGANEGSFSLSLTIGGGFRFGAVAYDVSGNGFHKTGTIDEAGSSVLSTVIGGIPFGTGYALQLTAHDADNKLTPCVGSASFSVTSATTVPVPVHLTCREIPSAVPSAVPVPAWARYALAALLLGLGTSLVRRRDRAARG